MQNHHLQASFTGFSFSPDHNLVARKRKKSQANLQALLATPFLTLLRARFGPSASRDSLAAHLSGVTLKSSTLNPRDLRHDPCRGTCGSRLLDCSLQWRLHGPPSILLSKRDKTAPTLRRRLLRMQAPHPPKRKVTFPALPLEMTSFSENLSLLCACPWLNCTRNTITLGYR